MIVGEMIFGEINATPEERLQVLPLVAKVRFKRVFNSNKEEGDTMDYALETVRREIRELTGEKVWKETGKNFYYGVNLE